MIGTSIILRRLIYFYLLIFPLAALAFEIDLANDWSARFDGFLSLSLIEDTKGSFSETLRNGPVQSSDTGQFLESVRYSRLAFTLFAPEFNGLRSKIYIEVDFAGAKLDRDQDISNATLRLRHAYYQAEKANWTLLVGQSWTLFGWNPSFFLSTVSFAPSPATLFLRTTEVLVSSDQDLGASWSLRLAGSLEQPSQRSANLPNLVAGAKLSYSGIQAPLSSLTGDPKLEPLGLALSATTKRFRPALDTNSPASTLTSFATSASIFLPLLRSQNFSLYESLSLRGSFASGSGYADTLPGWTSNLAPTPTLDAGQGGFSAQNVFSLLKMTTWNVQLQAQLSERLHLTLNTGYGQVRAANLEGLGPIAKNQAADGLYNGIDFYFLNVIKDLSPAIRLGLEISQDITAYLSGREIGDNRYLALAGYKF